MCLHEISGPPPTDRTTTHPRHLNHRFISLCFLFSLTHHPFRIVGKLWRVFYSLSPKAAPTFWITLFPASLTLLRPRSFKAWPPRAQPSSVVLPCPSLGSERRPSPALTSSNLLCNLLRIWHRTLARLARSISGSSSSNMKNQTKDAAACVLRVFCLPAVCVCPSRSLSQQHVSPTISPFLCLSVAVSPCLWQECPGNSADRQQGQCVLIIVVIISWACSEREANVNIIKIKAVKWTNWVEPWVGWSDGCCFPTFFLIASFIYFLYVCVLTVYICILSVSVWVLLFVCKSVQWPVTKWERVDGHQRQTANDSWQLFSPIFPSAAHTAYT